MKTLEGRGLTREQIALYQQLEKHHRPGFNAKNPKHWLLATPLLLTVPVVLPFMVLLTGGIAALPLTVWKLFPVMAWYWTTPFALIAGPVVLMQAKNDELAAKRAR